MKLLWLCNLMPAAVETAVTGRPSTGGLWMDSVLSDLQGTSMELRLLCRGGAAGAGELSDRLSYRIFQEKIPQRYESSLEHFFLEQLREFSPDVIHIWGTEYGHTLAMANAAQQAGLLEHTVISIQGLCSVIAEHCLEGIPLRTVHSYTLRDWIRRDNLYGHRRIFRERGKLEIEALEKAHHVIGRTSWDRACTARIQPERVYHFCNETLRGDFYTGQWPFTSSENHRIFASSCAYPNKGFHFLLKALAQVRRRFPDATLAVPGASYLSAQRTSYQKYLAKLTRQLGLTESVTFLGSLSAQQMKQAYLSSNVFVMPSTIENSPNSLGEAMLLGLPCVAADVGGVSDLMVHGKEGYVYQSTAPYMLAHFIEEVFADPSRAHEMGKAAAEHARLTHDPAENFRTLLKIYDELAGGQL